MKINNRHQQSVAISVQEAQPHKGLAFVMHGLGGFRDQDHIVMMVDELSRYGYTVVSFDTTNSIGESDGSYEDATVTGSLHDLEDVIGWAATQTWFQQPFLLMGHSMGAMCTALYAEAHPEQVSALAPISALVSGPISLEYKRQTTPQEIEAWEETGWLTRLSTSKPGEEMRLKWSHMADRLQYDLLPLAVRLTMPVLLVVGSRDITTPVEQQELLYEKLPGKKELKVIQGMEHTPRGEYLDEVRQILAVWLEGLT